jgi:hypothetical protein
MMESAKSELEQRGRFVAGGFLAPDHDGYVAHKCGTTALSAEERVHLTYVATAANDWLTADPWAALHVDRAINFTDIMRRLSLYLRMHIQDDLDVAFVCGGDNAGFSRAFRDQGNLIVVPRGDKPVEIDPLLVDSQRIIVAASHTPNSFASRSIRAGQSEGSIDEVEKTRLSLKRRTRCSSATIILRDENEWALSGWATTVPKDALRKAAQTFTAALIDRVRESLNRGYQAASSSVSFMPLTSQQEAVAAFRRAEPLPIISLDGCIPGDFNVALSRYFQLTTGERLHSLYNRPDAPELVTQIEAIPPGRYVLMDDDIATGETIRRFLALLPPHVQVEKIIAVQQLVCGHSLATVESHDSDDIVDAGDVRDFLVGSREGGLAVRLPNNEIARVPYLYPYVQNYRRMSIPLSQEIPFSRALWRLNADFFQSLPALLCVQECPAPFQRFAHFIGLAPTTPLSEMCLWHAEQLGPSL